MSPPQRLSATDLARLLNSAKQPIYALDEELTIVFLNRAAYEWLATEESLVGRRCAYHSSPAATGPDAVVAGLCPPPRVLSGETVIATVARVAEDGRVVERRARFVPMGDEIEGLLGILAIVDSADQPPAFAGGDPLSKTSETSEMEEAMPSALHDQVRRFRQEAALRYRADRLIGQGPTMRLARRQVELAVASRSSVLLVGPPGSGRRHLAAAIHYGANIASRRETPPHCNGGASGSGGNVSDVTLIPLDCSLLGADLLEAVAAAVARGKRSGGQASPGALLLHRVDELSADVQVELAGLCVRRPIVWRLLATAAEPLLELVRRGKFRDDLAAALSTIVIELPPLVRRRDDLPLLAQLFLEDLNAAHGRQIGGFTSAALDLLESYGWPGNLDELAAVVAESHQRAAGLEIDVADLPDRLRLASQAAAQPRRPEETIVLNEYLGRVERELIRRALARAKGNKARAARLLGMTRARLYRRMVQLGLEQGGERRGERGEE